MVSDVFKKNLYNVYTYDIYIVFVYIIEYTGNIIWYMFQKIPHCFKMNELILTCAHVLTGLKAPTCDC